MQVKIIVLILTQILKLLSPDLLRKMTDKLLDVVEDFVKASENDIDDAIVLPLCNMVREAFNIPDDD